MELRLILYGYRKEQFEYHVVPEEAEIVRYIFDEYSRKRTLLSIAQELTERQITYFEKKTNWSKQIVRRIIENEHYIGDDEYPQIIDKKIFSQANELRLNKGGDREKDSLEIAFLKQICVCERCGGRFTRLRNKGARERWICNNGCTYTEEYLDDNELISKINEILVMVYYDSSLLNLSEEYTFEPTREYLYKERDVKLLFSGGQADFVKQKNALFDLISEKFSMLKFEANKDFSVLLMNYIIDNQVDTSKLNFELMKKVVSSVIVQKDGNIKICFINGRTISRIDGGYEHEFC